MEHFAVTSLMTMIFVIGYFFITIEHLTHVNKATVALLMAIFCWVVLYAETGIAHSQNYEFLCHHISSISQIIFFLLGALSIVEMINAHNGFKIISDFIQVTSKKQLLWIVGGVTFFLSAVLDNLTTTIVMVSLLQKLIDEKEDRLLIGGGVVIAANAGGAWTPIGDVTTTMLWIGGQISATQVMSSLFLVSVIAATVSLFSLSFFLKGKFQQIQAKGETEEPYANLILVLGILSLVFVPVFKMMTGLPPFMGILLSLGFLWLVTDLLHRKRKHLTMTEVFSNIDLAGVLFFLGILLCIAALETAGILENLAATLSHYIGDLHLVSIVIGIASAVVDNVPLVAATMSMYDLTQIPQDHSFWLLTAYAAGTGGSMLIIGSAAGVVYMALEKVDFFWYLKRISLSAALGYFAGIGVYFLLP